MKRFLFLWVIYFVLITLFTFFARELVSAAPPANFQTSQVLSGLDSPTGFDITPDGRIFILERTGKVRVYKNGQLLPTPFAEVLTVTTGDRGLLGIAIDPEYESGSPYVYVYYTGIDEHNRIARYDATGDTATGNPTIIYQSYSPSEWLHIGGTIAFGLDGKLYLSIGDNGYPLNAQDLSFANHFGKVLRFNKDGTIPSDNPLVGLSGLAPEIWAWGLRNPFRFNFDPATGKLYLGDVGQDTWEEINFVEKGKNYGWPTCEGVCTEPGMTNPIFTYNHDDGSGNHDASIVGGPVYRGTAFPIQYQGQLFYGDYAKGFLKTLDLTSNQISDFDSSVGTVVDIKVGLDEAIYYVTIYPGALYKVTHTGGGNQPPIVQASADVTQGTAPLTVNFSSAGTIDPESDPLTYDWSFGDGTNSSDANPSKTYNIVGQYIVVLTLTDGTNFSQADPITIQIGTPPSVTVTSPISGSTYKAGNTIFYSANGTDSSGNPLPDSAFKTEIIFHHGVHIHPFIGPITSREGEFTIPDQSDESATNVWFEIKITGTDSDGLSTTDPVNIYPEVSSLTLGSQPSGMTLLLDGSPVETPSTSDEVVGMKHELSVPVIQEVSGAVYQFDNWSTGRAVKHIIEISETPTIVTANFSVAPSFSGEYFANKNLQGTPALTRTDSKVDFNWNYGSPDPTIAGDQFSVRWTKMQFFPEGEYRFKTVTDDGVRLFVDGNLIIDEWHDQSSVPHQVDITLSGGEHEIKMEYFENSGVALAILSWDLSPNQPAEPIPNPDENYQAEYWNTPGAGAQPEIPITPPDLTRQDSDIDFDWGWGSPDPAIASDHFVTRWTKNDSFENATYRFNVTSDDGMRIYLDGSLILDKWIDQSPTSYSVDVPISAGVHEIKVEYYENSGIAVSKVVYFKAVGTQGSGGGLLATYYDNMDLTGQSKSKIDAQINFDWGWGSPDSAIAADTFSTRWSGQIMPEFSETYTFSTTTDDGVRLWIDNQLIIDKWVDQPPSQWSGSISLVGGQKYTIVMEYYENGGIAQAKLYWESATLPKEIVPQDRLFSETQEAFSGEYWNTPGVGASPAMPTTPANITKQDLVVDFDWGWGSPDPAIAADHFVARWTKNEQFAAGDHTFTIQSDDGVRFYVDDILIVDDWTDHSTKNYTPVVTLTDGTHTLKLEYYENGGVAVAKLQY